MPPTTTFSFGDVVLVPFPFTDQTVTKRRPAVVVSSQDYNKERPDIIIMAISSQVKTPAGFGEVLVRSWKEAGLIKPSTIKPIFTTVEKGLVLKKLGTLAKEDQLALKKTIAEILEE